MRASHHLTEQQLRAYHISLRKFMFVTLYLHPDERLTISESILIDNIDFWSFSLSVNPCVRPTSLPNNS